MIDIVELAAWSCGAMLLANLVILALNIKLYTEIFKARDQRRS